APTTRRAPATTTTPAGRRGRTAECRSGPSGPPSRRRRGPRRQQRRSTCAGASPGAAWARHTLVAPQAVERVDDLEHVALAVEVDRQEVGQVAADLAALPRPLQ